MGFYEQFLGWGVVPTLLGILLLLAFVPATRQFNQIIIKFADAKINIEGVNIRVLPTLAFINLVSFYVELQKIKRLDKIEAASGENSQARSGYLQELYLHNRNALLHLCTTILIMQLYLTAHRYEKFRVILDQAEKIKKTEEEANGEEANGEEANKLTKRC